MATARRKKVTMEIKNFAGGSNHLLDEGRLKPTEAKTATNLIQVQDGLWKPRWGTAYYGADLGDTCDGACEYVKSDETTELIAVAGGKAYKSSNGGAWSEISGATFTAGTQCYFMQIASYLYISNGTDALARYNGTALTTYSALNAPASLSASLVASGLTSGSYSYYGVVTALNEVGETVGSTEASITTNKLRENWTAATDKVMWSWASVASATRYQFYLGDQSTRNYLLAGTSNTFLEDNGTLQPNTYVEVPISNTTGAPKFKSMNVSGNRIWGTNDPNNKYTVYWSGTGTDIGKFSDFYGGGWVNLEKGGRELPTKGIHYQSGSGDGRQTILCRTPEGKGAIWQITLDLITVGDTQFTLPTTSKVVGSFGTDSVLGVVATTNDILFPNKRGVYSLGPEKNFYGILRTNEITSRIRPYWRNLYGGEMDEVCGYFYDAKVFFSVPTNSTGNTRTVVYDLERVNWTVDWTIGAKQFLEYTDTSGKTHFLYTHATETYLVEISENIQGDLGQAISTNYTSGRMPLSKIWKDFVKVNKLYVKLGNPRGVINLEVSGSEKNRPFTSLAAVQVDNQDAIVSSGLGWDLMGDVLMGDTEGTPEYFTDSAASYYVNIRKKLRDIKISVTTNTIDADYVLQGFVIEGNLIKVNPPSSWRLS
jgi:hypothetical protein